MSDRFHCPIHGVRLVDSYNDGCPDCQYAAWELRNAVEAQSRLGEYDCPYCLQTSLKFGASRCPLCRGDVGSEYWDVVRAKNKADEEARLAEAARKKAREDKAAAEWMRAAPQREAEARAAAAEAERVRRKKDTVDMVGAGFILGPVGCGILLGLAGCVSCVNNQAKVNTILTPFNLLNGLFYGVLIGLVVGPLLGYAIAQMKQ
jgi:hypothetical protein